MSIDRSALRLNAMEGDEAIEALHRCCGCHRWARAVAGARPFSNGADLIAKAREHWGAMSDSDVREAFAHHPRIGANIEALRAKFKTAELSASEQAGVEKADEETLIRLRDGNKAYEARYGHIFLICATGKSAKEMLSALEERMKNTKVREFAIARGEQMKITELRLQHIAAGDAS